MCDNIQFLLDTEGDDNQKQSQFIYMTNGKIEDQINDDSTKPSQERPPILKQKAKRYHEKGNDKKYIPGKMSHELRKALGLGFYDIPEHVYRMRHLSYPPGWLKKAQVIRDNISITGVNVTVNTSTNTQIKYDWEKLHEYPGFNTLKNYDYKYDRCREFGFMSMQNDMLLENFLVKLSENRMLGKEAVNMKDIRSKNRIETNTDFNLPITPAANSTPISKSRKRKVSDMDLSDGEVEDDSENIIEDASVNEEKQLDKNEQTAKVAKIENGTFLLIPSAAKPSLDSFSDGINDHRLFENLPNTGGVYEKVRKVLKRIL